MDGLSIARRTHASVAIIHLNGLSLERSGVCRRGPYLVKDVDVLSGNKGQLVTGKRRELHSAHGEGKVVASRADPLGIRECNYIRKAQPLSWSAWYNNFPLRPVRGLVELVAEQEIDFVFTGGQRQPAFVAEKAAAHALGFHVIQILGYFLFLLEDELAVRAVHSGGKIHIVKELLVCLADGEISRPVESQQVMQVEVAG